MTLGGFRRIARFRFVLVPALLLLAALCAVGLFLTRKPIVVVSDAAFETLYGERRASAARLGLSLLAFRPVALALVSENAAPASSADAAALAAGNRGFSCVLFPSRYREGAAAFLEKEPDAAVAVVGAIGSELVPAKAAHVDADRVLDAYRAGRAAGKLAAGRSLVFRSDEIGDPSVREAFFQGASDGGFGEVVSFIHSGESRSATSAAFLVDVSVSPDPSPCAILYSWADPAFLPQETELVFDDSLYALSFAAYRAGMRRISGKTPSSAHVLPAARFSPRRFFDIQAAILSRRH